MCDFFLQLMIFTKDLLLTVVILNFKLKYIFLPISPIEVNHKREYIFLV